MSATPAVFSCAQPRAGLPYESSGRGSRNGRRKFISATSTQEITPQTLLFHSVFVTRLLPKCCLFPKKVLFFIENNSSPPAKRLHSPTAPHALRLPPHTTNCTCVPTTRFWYGPLPVSVSVYFQGQHARQQPQHTPPALSALLPHPARPFTCLLQPSRSLVPLPNPPYRDVFTDHPPFPTVSCVPQWRSLDPRPSCFLTLFCWSGS
jgi:hypothetical protein